MTLRCSYGSYFGSEVKLWQAAEKAPKTVHTPIELSTNAQ
jgi:hypothetical protein